MFFSAIIILLWSEWQYGYNQFMALKRGMSLAEAQAEHSLPDPLSEPTLIGTRLPSGRITPDNAKTSEILQLRKRLADLENAARRARVRLPDVDSCAEQLIPIVDSVEELLYDMGYQLDFEEAFQQDCEPEFKKMKPTEGYNPEETGLSQKPNLFTGTDCTLRMNGDQDRCMHD
jgi:hypothetical protein